MKRNLFFLMFFLFLQAAGFSQSFTWTKVVSVDYPTGIIFDENDSLWYIVQGSGLYEKSGSQIIDHSSGLITTNVITIDYASPHFWIGGYGGITDFDGTNYVGYDDTSGLMGFATYEVKLSNGNPWLAMETEGASYFAGSTWTHYTGADGLVGDWFTTIAVDSNGTVFLGANDFSASTLGILNVFDGNNWTVLDTNDGLFVHNLRCLFVDTQNNLWIGGNGLIKYDGMSFTTIIPDTLSRELSTIVEDNDGNIWFTSYYNDVYVYDGSNVIATNAPVYFEGKIQGLAKNANGEIFACLNDGIYKVVPTTYTVTTTANPANGGTTTGDGNYLDGQTATVTASPAVGYHFVNWTENSTEVSTDSSYSFTVTSDRNLVANFEVETYTITVNANPTNGGNVAGGGSYDYGQTATVTATPESGYNFINWTENGIQVSTEATYSFTVDSDRNLIANFSDLDYTITASANPSEGGTVSGSGGYNYGDTATLIATPAGNYAFVNWTENGTEVSTDSIFSFVVTADRTLIANFQKINALERNKQSYLIILPNPAADFVSIRLPENTLMRQNFKIILTDIYGKNYFAKNVCNSRQIFIDVSQYPTGVYFVRLYLDDKFFASQRLIIVR